MTVPNPRYRSIADHIRHDIASGDIATSGALPTESELTQAHGVSRSTIRKALGILKAEGWIEARQGSGWSVPISRRGRQFGTFRLRVESSGEGQGVAEARPRPVDHGRRRPPAAVARRLLVDRRRALLVVDRLTEVDGKPVHRSETWFNAALTETLSPEAAVQQPPARLLAELGFRFGPIDQYAEAVSGNDDDQRLLGIDELEPVLQIVRTACTIEGTPLFQSVHRHPGSVVRLEIDFPTTDHAEGLLVGFSPETGP